MTGLPSHRAGVAEPASRFSAPADRPVGRRGVRAPAAAIVAMAALWPLGLGQFEAEDPAWTRPGFLAAGVAAMAAAVLLWTARRRLTLMVGVGLALTGLVVTVAATVERQRVRDERDRWGGLGYGEVQQRGPRLSRAEAESVPKGLTRAQLVERLGPAATTGIQHVVDEPDLRCLAYRSIRANAGIGGLHAFCFHDGRYVELRGW